MAVFAYCRVSTQRQVDEGHSLDVQRRQIEGYALMHGLHLDDVIVEEGVSGSMPIRERPAGAALFARLQTGDVLIASKLDRLFRSAYDALAVVEALKVKGVRLHLIDLGGDIAGNGLSKLFLTIAAAFAEAERDRIKERIANTKADQKAQGRYLGGTPPFGFRVAADGSLEPDPAQQAAILKIRQLHGEGQSLRKIAGEIAKDGIRLSHVAVGNVLKAS